MRLQRSLAGSWQFRPDPEGIFHVENLVTDSSIRVPMPWQAAFPELETYSGYAWYRTTLDLETNWLNGELLLTFGAVDYWCQVYVNQQLVGEHEGGYTPFTFSIRSFAHSGHNEIAIRVYDSANNGDAPTRWLDQKQHNAEPPFDPRHIPHGKQDWYLNVGGLWQDVTLTAVPTLYLDQVKITPSISGSAVVHIDLAGEVAHASGSLHLLIEDQHAETVLTVGQSSYDLTLQIPHPRLWTPESPTLYAAAITLKLANTEDSRIVRFGFREISYGNGQLLLNGDPIYLRAALDQDMYPETIYTIPSEAFMRDEFRKAKELGLNCLRCHIKPPDPLYLDLADEMGLLVWAEIPSWRTFYMKTTIHPDHFNVNDAIKARAQHTLIEMIRRDFNHPSLIIWTIVNEDWGTALALSPNDRAWVIEMYDLCKHLDPIRLVVDNSACLNDWGPNIHVKSDLDDFHIYANIPDNAAFFTRFIERFSQRPTWSYSNHGDTQRSGQEPLILSEFGNWGLPSVKVLSDKHGTPPDWFKLGPWWSGWGGEPGWPKDVVARFKSLGLDTIWPDYEDFAVASQWHQYQAMKFEIEVMRRQSALQGYVITELSDIYWESNGLLDFNRGTKAYHQVFNQMNAADVVVPEMARYATWDDQTVPVHLYASHYSGADWSAPYLEWTIDGQKAEQQLATVARGNVSDLGPTEWRFTPSSREKATARTVKLTITSGGKTLAQNEVAILVLPASLRQPTYKGQLFVEPIRDPFPPTGQKDSPLAINLQKIGYQIANTAISRVDSTSLLVSDAPSPEALRWVRDGGTLFYLCQEVSPFFWVQGRGGTYGGNWISSFNWLRPEIHRRLEFSNPLTLPFGAVAPHGVIAGLPVEDTSVQCDFLAGQITGWVQHPAVHTVQFRYGRGKVLMTTYNLTGAIAQPTPDPVGVVLLHDLIDYVASGSCQPVLVSNI